VTPAQLLRRIIRGEDGATDLTDREAYQLGGMMLDGGVSDLELGALLTALRHKGLVLEEWLGFHRSLSERVHHLRVPEAPARPVVLSSQHGAVHEPNLLPLLALLLTRFGIPVLAHGTLQGNGRVACAHVFRELNVAPCTTLAQAQNALGAERLAFVPTPVFSPGLAVLLALRARLGFGNFTHTLAKLLDPFAGEGCRVVSVSGAKRLAEMREVLAATGGRALLLQGTEGEAFANPRRRPQIEYFEDGRSRVLFEAEAGRVRVLPNLPPAVDAVSTAAWTREALAGRVPLPMPIVNQLACCLFASGYTEDMNQAKAIVAVKSLGVAA
jgi:anthranilate phosphoribosyltransferase